MQGFAEKQTVPSEQKQIQHPFTPQLPFLTVMAVDTRIALIKSYSMILVLM